MIQILYRRAWCSLFSFPWDYYQIEICPIDAKLLFEVYQCMWVFLSFFDQRPRKDPPSMSFPSNIRRQCFFFQNVDTLKLILDWLYAWLACNLWLIHSMVAWVNSRCQRFYLASYLLVFLDRTVDFCVSFPWFLFLCVPSPLQLRGYWLVVVAGGGPCVCRLGKQFLW